jgi:serine/threonine protein phosphatase PrpC
MKVRVGAKTDVGRVRDRNEDAYLIREPLFAVADGMGGHRGGDVASSMTVDALERADLPPDAPLGVLVAEIKKANQEVLRRGESDQGLRGMGTTLTAFVTDRDRAYVAHVGDSRAYLLRDGALQRLTRDHTLVERMVEEGRIQPDQARHHPQRSILTRALGVEDEVEVDDLTVDPIQPGDRILLCTDGLSAMVDEAEIDRILREEGDPQAAAERLVEAAIQAGGDDNVTVIVLDIEDGQSAKESDSSSAVEDEPPPHAVLATDIEDEEGEDHGPSRPSRRRRLMVGLAVALVVVVAAFIGARVYVGQQWYVGESAGRVAIYKGIPTDVLGFDLSHVEETTDLAAADVERLAFWSKLPDGITADSLQAARALVTQMRQDVAAAKAPSK